MKTIDKAELRKLYQQPIYQGLLTSYDPHSIFLEWFHDFHKLEKEDVWEQLNPVEREFAYQQEQDRINGVKRVQDPLAKKRAFDDVSDPSNMGFLPQQLKHLSRR